MTGMNLLWLYAGFNLVEALLGYSAGALADRIGRLPLLISGYLVFAVVYLGFGMIGGHAIWEIWVLFFLYGGYSVLTKGAEKAFAADLVDPEKRGAQLGAFHTITGLALLPASVVAGILFDWNPSAPFLFSSLVAIVSAGLLLRMR